MSKFAGKDVSLKVEIASVYTTIAQIRDLNPPNLEQTPIDVTNRDGSGWMEFIGGLKNGGEVTFDIVYDPDQATHSASASGGLITLLSAGTLNNFRITFPDPTPVTATFAALVTKFAPKAPLNDKLAADVTLKVSSSITWA